MKLRTILPFTALTLLASAASAQTVSNDGYARDMSADVVKNPFGLCWHTGQWTETKSVPGCDGEAPRVRMEFVPVAAPVVPQVAEPALVIAPRPQPAPIAAAPIAPAPAVVPISVRRQAITLGADTSFDTGKADLKREGQAKLEELAAKLRGVEFDSIRVTGHTDNVGSDVANQKLSLRRANAVKQYLASRGIDPAKIKTTGQGKAKPIADNKSTQGRARNRRVQI